jgi:hypothetical protein
MWCHIDKRVNTWEAFWMAETSPAWVDAKAEKKHERQRARTTKDKDVLVIFFQMVHPLF